MTQKSLSLLKIPKIARSFEKITDLSWSINSSPLDHAKRAFPLFHSTTIFYELRHFNMKSEFSFLQSARDFLIVNITYDGNYCINK